MRPNASPKLDYQPVPYTPPFWLRNRHIQTIHGDWAVRRFDARHDPWLRSRETVLFDLPDGDRLQGYLHLQPDDPDRERPVVLHLHGLEAHGDSGTSQGFSSKAYAAGFHSVRVSYRNCGDTEHLARGLYNGERTADLHAVVAALRQRWGFSRVYLTGISLGAGLALRVLLESGDGSESGVAGGVAVSPPLDFHACGVAFRQGLNRIYDWHFLRSLKRKMERKLTLSPGGEELAPVVARARKVRTLREFDEIVTGPMMGHADAAAYYTAASTADRLHELRLPTLILHAEDDPILPYSMFTERMHLLREIPELTLHLTRLGGHVGFYAAEPGQRAWWNDCWWAENEAMAYLLALEAAR